MRQKITNLWKIALDNSQRCPQNHTIPHVSAIPFNWIENAGGFRAASVWFSGKFSAFSWIIIVFMGAPETVHNSSTKFRNQGGRIRACGFSTLFTFGPSIFAGANNGHDIYAAKENISVERILLLCTNKRQI